MSFIFGIVNLKGGPIKSEDVRKLGKAVQWDDFDSKIEINDSYGWGYCWNKKRAPKAGIYTSERVAVLCDARIYNGDEFKQSFEFEQPEEAFAKAYLKWDTGFADKFNGDFAAVIIDFQQQKVLLVRDHIGVRPLTYSVKDDLLIFASHEFGIARSQLVDNSLSEIALIQDFYPFNKQEYSLTVFESIRKTVPGYIYIVDYDRIKHYIYWTPEGITTDNTLSLENAVSLLRRHLKKAVEQRLNDGIIGAHVSGGLDSSGVAALIADCIDKKDRLKGYSWSPEINVGEIDGVNEKNLVNDLSRQKEIDVVYMTYSNPANIEDFILPEFEQVPIEIHTMRQAAKDDVNCIFSGWGGDEFVSLGVKGTINHIFFRCKVFALICWMQQKGIKATLLYARREILPLFDPLGLLGSGVIDRNGMKFFKFQFILKHWRYFFFNKGKSIYGYGNRIKFMHNLLYQYHLPQRMDSWAIFGEQFGLDYKYPLLDKELLEFWFTIPVEFTYQNMSGRYLFKEAMNGILTESIRTRENKSEAVLYNSYWARQIKIRDILAAKPNLFRENSYLHFFKSAIFYNCALSKTLKRREFVMNMYDIRFFLRYKSLVEKYVDTNPYCMKKQKKNSDSENL
ncbi:MAG: asparagine synthase-related protein [Bacteroidota bacterium]|nr:asparagine synthase-related protein [Bacteroidota bacterium]